MKKIKNYFFLLLLFSCTITLFHGLLFSSNIGIQNQRKNISHNALLEYQPLAKLHTSSSTSLWNFTANRQVNSVDISDDGQYVVVGEYDNQIYLFNRNSSTPLWNYTTGDSVFTVAISSNGSYIVAGSRDKNVYLFGKESHVPIWNYTTGGNICSVSISADASYIVAGSEDSKIYLFNRTSPIPIWEYTTKNIVDFIRISSDGSYIVGSGCCNDLYFFHRSNSTPLWTFTSPANFASVGISSTGRYIIAYSGDTNFYLLERSNNIPLWNYSTGHTDGKIAISADENYIIVGAGNGVYLFNRSSPIPLWYNSAIRPISFHGLDPTVAISKHGNYIVVGTENSYGLHFFNRTSSVPMWTHDSRDWVTSTAISQNGQYIVGGSMNNYGENVFLFHQTDGFLPDIKVHSPLKNVLYGTDPPDYNITIVDENIDSNWYSLDGGLTNLKILESSGGIDQNEWDKFVNGTVTITFFANDTANNIEQAEVTVRKDILAPIIAIVSPTASEEFNNAPIFDITINEANLDEFWYTIDNGANNYTITSLTGTINQTAWNAISDGPVTIRFYARDDTDNIGSNSVIVVKSPSDGPQPPTPDITINSPTDSQIIGENAPSYTLSITGPYESIWYTFDGGLTNHSASSLTGSLNQAAWFALSDGIITIVFYANNSAGMIGAAQVQVFKDSTEEPPPEPPAIPGFNPYLLLGFIGIISGLLVRKRLKS